MGRDILNFFRDLKSAFSRWQSDDGWLMAAAIAYYLGISFFPLLLVLIAGLGLFLESTHLGQDAQQRVLDAIAQNASPQLAEYVRDTLSTVSRKSSTTGPIGLLGMLVASLAAFAQLDAAFDRIWNVKAKESPNFWWSILGVVIGRGRAFVLLLALGIIIVLVFIAGLALSAVSVHATQVLPFGDWASRGMQSAFTIGVNVVVFTLMHKYLPKTRVYWENALRGGILTTAGWEIGRQVLTLYISRAGFSSAYGVVGAFLGVQLWCYYAVIIVLVGAEWVQLRQERQEKE